MKLELTIDRDIEFPKCAVPVLGKILLKIHQNQFDGCSMFIRRAFQDGLSVYGGETEAKKKVQKTLKQTWESADD